MTRNQKLDKILQLLKFREYQKLDNDELQNRMTIKIILKSNFDDTDETEIKYLTNILIGDGYIEKDESQIDGLYSITREGERFIDDGGYVKRQSDIDNKRKIDDLTIKSLNRSKYALLLSGIAIIVSIVSLFF